MAFQALINLHSDQLRVSGVLNFNTITMVWKDSLPLLARISHLRFDLSGVTFCNSAAFALLVEWKRWARENQKDISFENIPLQLQSILNVCGIAKF